MKHCDAELSRRGLALEQYSRVGRWIARIEALPRYIGMPGI